MNSSDLDPPSEPAVRNAFTLSAGQRGAAPRSLIPPSEPAVRNAFTLSAGQRGAAPRSLIPAGSLEAIKWFACLFMLVEHFFRFAVPSLTFEIYSAGRIVFPMFALALAYGVASLAHSRIADVLLRLTLVAIAASLVQFFTIGFSNLNVLFTLALGLALSRAFASASMLAGLAIAIVCLALSPFIEYGALGILAVFLFCEAARSKDLVSQCFGIGVGFICISVVNQSLFPLLAIPFVALLIGSDFHVPRLKRLFYFIYVLQFPFFSGVAWFVA